MAVYTHVDEVMLGSLLDQYDLGAALAFKGIAEGSENSNYLLDTERGRFILTLYEKRVRGDDLPYFLGLMEHLAGHGLACPLPVHDRNGRVLQKLAGRDAALVTFLSGVSADHPTPRQCRSAGAALARLHQAGGDFPQQRSNDLGLAGWQSLIAGDGPKADQVEPGLRALLEDESAQLAAHWPTGLPQGVIHADLFPDNVLFLGDEVSGIIDFYFACHDLLAYDLAILINAWCFDAAHRFDPEKAAAVLDGYGAVRPLTAAEHDALLWLLRGAALRFLLTRLHDWLRPQEGALVARKNPLDYGLRLQFWRAAPSGILQP